jgi:hypothetical protein
LLLGKERRKRAESYMQSRAGCNQKFGEGDGIGKRRLTARKSAFQA